MRTTITLESDVVLIIQRDMKERGAKFKDAVNDLIRRGAGAGPPEVDPELPTLPLGRPLVDLANAHRLAEELEDDEHIRAMQVGR